MSRVDALDAVVTSVGTKVGAGATAATATTNGDINVSGTLIGIAQAAQGVVDFASKGLQASEAMWAKGVPLVGSGLGLAGLVEAYSGKGPQSQADYAGVVSNGATVLGGVAALYSFPIVATGLGVIAIGAGGYQIYQSAIALQQSSNPNYSNEGRNYQTPTYNFNPTNWRGKDFTDPRLLDNAGSYRGLNTYSSVYASQTAENTAFENDWNTAINAYSMQPGYTSFPTDLNAYKGLEDAFGANPNSIFNSYSTDWNSFQNNGNSFDYGNNSGFGSYDFGYEGWYPLVIDLDGDGASIAGLFKVRRTDGKLVDGADVAFAYQKADVKETVDAQGNKVFTFEDGGVYKHMVMNSTQTDVTLPDTSGVNRIGVTGIATNDALYRRWANV